MLVNPTGMLLRGCSVFRTYVFFSFFCLQMKSLKDKLREWFTPRQHTDLQSEILNIIAGPIYVYTITSVYIHGLVYLIPYFYGQSGVCALRFQFIFCTFIYIQMMLNWLCIVFVDNSLYKYRNSSTSIDSNSSVSLNSVVIGVGKEITSKGNRTIPGPKSDPVHDKKQSYWSWKMCHKCHLKAPPRCHHCPMCDTCVLKRDHHCFFTRRCVGFHNQRHFIVFCTWASFASTYATIHFLIYYYKVLTKETSAWDVFAPFALLRWFFGDGSLATTNTIFTFSLNCLFIFLSTGFIIDQFELIKEGLTQFEQKSVDHNKLRIVDPRPLGDKVRAVFGHYYGLSFIFPFAHIFFPPHENPFEWPELKIYRGKMM